MAKAAAKAGATSRIRFVMFDAEVAEGEMGQLTQPIQNALRGPTLPTIKRITAPAQPLNGHVDQTDAEVNNDDIEDAADTEDSSPQAVRQRLERKPAPTPEVLEI